MRAPFTRWVAVAAGLVIGAGGGCGAGDPTAGMSGRQVVRGHDVGDLFFGNGSTVGFTRQAQDPASGGPQDLWAVGLDDAAPEVALSGIDWAPPIWWARLRVGELLQTGPDGRLFYDFAAHRAVDLSQFGAPATPVAGGTSRVAMRRDGHSIAIEGLDPTVFGVGPPAALQSFTLTGKVVALDFLGEDVVMVLHSGEGAEEVAGIYRLSVATGELTALVPPSPASEWTDTEKSCFLFGVGPCDLFRVIGCRADDDPCPGANKPPCAIFYGKEDPAFPGAVAAYVYDVNKGSGLRFPGQGPRSFGFSPDQHVVIWQSQVDPADPLTMLARYWDMCAAVETACPQAAANIVAWHPSGGGFALYGYGGPLLVASTASGTCGFVDDVVYQAQFSPAGDRLMWLADSGRADSTQTLWYGQTDGTEAIELATGMVTGARFSPDGQRAFLGRASQSTDSLGWVDVTASPPVEHTLATNYGGLSRTGNRRALFVDHWNSQDTSGELVLMEFDSGKKTLLGRAVSEFTISGDVDGGEANVAYAVRSRVASDRDGLWITALPP